MKFKRILVTGRTIIKIENDVIIVTLTKLEKKNVNYI